MILLWPNSEPSSSYLSPESRLLVLALLAGVLGSTLGSAEELFFTRKVYKRSVPAIAVFPLLGGGIAFIFYSVLRGGLLSVTPVTDGNVIDLINPFGVVALSGLVGLFINKAVFKLQAISDALFGTTEKEDQWKSRPPKRYEDVLSD